MTTTTAPPSPDAVATILADALARPGVSVMTEASAESLVPGALDVTAYAETSAGSVPLVTVTTSDGALFRARRYRFAPAATPVPSFNLAVTLASRWVADDLAHAFADAELVTEGAA